MKRRERKEEKQERNKEEENKETGIRKEKLNKWKNEGN